MRCKLKGLDNVVFGSRAEAENFLREWKRKNGQLSEDVRSILRTKKKFHYASTYILDSIQELLVGGVYTVEEDGVKMKLNHKEDPYVATNGITYDFSKPTPLRDILDFGNGILTSLIEQKRSLLETEYFKEKSEGKKRTMSLILDILDTLLEDFKIENHGVLLEKGNIPVVLNKIIKGVISRDAHIWAPTIEREDNENSEERANKPDPTIPLNTDPEEEGQDENADALEDMLFPEQHVKSTQSNEIDQLYNNKLINLMFSNLRYKRRDGTWETVQLKKALNYISMLFIEARVNNKNVEELLKLKMATVPSRMAKLAYARLNEILEGKNQETSGIFLDDNSVYYHGISRFEASMYPMLREKGFIVERKDMTYEEFLDVIKYKFYDKQKNADALVKHAYQVSMYRNVYNTIDTKFHSLKQKNVAVLKTNPGFPVHNIVQLISRPGDIIHVRNEVDTLINEFVNYDVDDYIYDLFTTNEPLDMIKFALYSNIISVKHDKEFKDSLVDKTPEQRLTALAIKYINDNTSIVDGKPVKSSVYAALDSQGKRKFFARIVELKREGRELDGIEKIANLRQIDKHIDENIHHLKTIYAALNIDDGGSVQNVVFLNGKLSWAYKLISNGEKIIEEVIRRQPTDGLLRDMTWDQVSIYDLASFRITDEVHVDAQQLYKSAYGMTTPNENSPKEFIMKEFIYQFLGWNAVVKKSQNFLQTLIITDKKKNMQLQTKMYKYRRDIPIPPELRKGYGVNIIAEMLRSNPDNVKHKGAVYERQKEKAYIAGIKSYSYNNGVYTLTTKSGAKYKFKESEVWDQNSQWDDILKEVFDNLMEHSDKLAQFIIDNDIVINDGTEINGLVKLGQVSKAGENIFGENNKLGEGTQQALLDSWVANYYLHSYSLKKEVLGDQVFYENAERYVHRAAIAFTDAVHTRDEGEYKVLITKDVKAFINEFTNMNLTQDEMDRLYGELMTIADSGAFILPERMTEMRDSYGSVIGIRHIYKPIYFHKINGVPMGIKYAGIEGTDAYVEAVPTLGILREWMRKHGISEIIDAGAVKMGLEEGKLVDFKVEMDPITGKHLGFSTVMSSSPEEIASQAITLKRSNLGIIFDPVANFEVIKFPHQLFGYFGEDGRKREEAREQQKDQAAIVKLKRNLLARRLRNTESIKEELISDMDLDDQNAYITEMLRDEVNTNHPLLKNIIVSKLHNKISKNVIGFKMPGARLVLSPITNVHEYSYLDEDGKIQKTKKELVYNNENGYTEVLLSKSLYMAIYGDGGKDGYENHLIGFRTPSGSLRSGLRIKVVGYLDTPGNIITAPKEISYFMGSDYDVDELNVIRKVKVPNRITVPVWTKTANRNSAYVLKDIKIWDDPTSQIIRKTGDTAEEGTYGKNEVQPLLRFIEAQFDAFFADTTLSDSTDVYGVFMQLVDPYVSMLQNSLVERMGRELVKARADLLTPLGFEMIDGTMEKDQMEGALEYVFPNGVPKQEFDINLPLDAASLNATVNMGGIIDKFISILRGANIIKSLAKNGKPQLSTPIKVFMNNHHVMFDTFSETFKTTDKDGNLIDFVIYKTKEKVWNIKKKEVELNKKVRYDIKTYHFAETLANLILDHLKHVGKGIDAINLNEKNMQAWMAGVMLGIHPKYLTALFNQPIVKDYENPIYNQIGEQANLYLKYEKLTSEPIVDLDALRNYVGLESTYNGAAVNTKDNFVSAQLGALQLYKNLMAQGMVLNNHGAVGGFASKISTKPHEVLSKINRLNEDWDISWSSKHELSEGKYGRSISEARYPVIWESDEEAILKKIKNAKARVFENGVPVFKNLDLGRNEAFIQQIITALKIIHVDSKINYLYSPEIMRSVRESVLDLVDGLVSYEEASKSNEPGLSFPYNKIKVIEQEHIIAEKLHSLLVRSAPVNTMNVYDISMDDIMNMEYSTIDILGKRYGYKTFYGIKAFNTKLADDLRLAQKRNPDNEFLQNLSLRPDKKTHDITIYFNDTNITSDADRQRMSEAMEDLIVIEDPDIDMIDLFNRLVKYNMLNIGLAYGKGNYSTVLPLDFQNHISWYISSALKAYMRKANIPGTNYSQIANELNYVMLEYLQDNPEILMPDKKILKIVNKKKNIYGTEIEHSILSGVDELDDGRKMFFDARIPTNLIGYPPTVMYLQNRKYNVNDVFVRNTEQTKEFYYYTKLPRNHDDTIKPIMRSGDRVRLAPDIYTLFNGLEPTINIDYTSGDTITVRSLSNTYSEWKYEQGDTVILRKPHDLLYTNRERYKIRGWTPSEITLDRMPSDDIQPQLAEDRFKAEALRIDLMKQKDGALEIVDTIKDYIGKGKTVINPDTGEQYTMPMLEDATWEIARAKDAKEVSLLDRKYCKFKVK